MKTVGIYLIIIGCLLLLSLFMRGKHTAFMLVATAATIWIVVRVAKGRWL